MFVGVLDAHLKPGHFQRLLPRGPLYLGYFHKLPKRRTLNQEMHLNRLRAVFQSYRNQSINPFLPNVPF